MRLLFLSATPMFNDAKEIVWLLNLMRVNDRRPKIYIKDIFDNLYPKNNTFHITDVIKYLDAKKNLEKRTVSH